MKNTNADLRANKASREERESGHKEQEESQAERATDPDRKQGDGQPVQRQEKEGKLSFRQDQFL